MSQQEILEVLQQAAGKLTAREICSRLNESYSAIQRNLRQMRKYHIIVCERLDKTQGRKGFVYNIHNDTINRKNRTDGIVCTINN
jgi:predicted transcriptional regulator